MEENRELQSVSPPPETEETTIEPIVEETGNTQPEPPQAQETPDEPPQAPEEPEPVREEKPAAPPVPPQPQNTYAPGGPGGFVPNRPAPPYYGAPQPPQNPYYGRFPAGTPRAGQPLPPPLPPRQGQPQQGQPRQGLSQRAIIGLVITCCVTFLLSVLIFTIGMVLKPVFEAMSWESVYQETGGSDYNANYGSEWDNWYDDYSPYGNGYDTPSAHSGELPSMEHSEDVHNAIEFLVSGVAYMTGADIDEGNDDQNYVAVTLIASNLGAEESGFQLSQITAQDSAGNVLGPVFPAYSYGLGLLPDSVTLQPKYQIRGVVIFTADHPPLTLVIREADGCEKRSIPIAAQPVQ